jgi:hypothetical protein
VPLPLTVRKQFQTLESIPQYFRAIAKEWMNILFGETLVGVVFLIWWALGSPPLVLIFVLAALVAGYYVWRSEYERFMPKVGIVRIRPELTPTSEGYSLLVIHLVPECLTDSPVQECVAHILHVFKREADSKSWEPTAINEPLALTWSIYDNSDPRTLYPGVPSRLNLCSLDALSRINLMGERVPFRFMDVFDRWHTFRFDVRLSAKDCSPVDVHISVKPDKTWCPIVEMIPARFPVSPQISN